jgi:hypothetical protein
MVAERVVSTHRVGILSIVAIFILFTVLLSALGLYFYKGFLTNKIAEMESDLNSAKNRFEPSKITELQLLDKRLRASSKVLSQHIAITPIFEALSAVTMKTVRFTNFGYSLSADPGLKVMVKMRGIAIGYRSVALQADLFTTKEEGKNFIDPVFSNLTLDDAGNVLFDLEFALDPDFVDYKQTLLTPES